MAGDDVGHPGNFFSNKSISIFSHLSFEELSTARNIILTCPRSDNIPPKPNSFFANQKIMSSKVEKVRLKKVKKNSSKGQLIKLSKQFNFIRWKSDK